MSVGQSNPQVNEYFVSPASHPDNPPAYRRYITEALWIDTSETLLDLTPYIDRGEFIDSGGFGEVYKGSWSQRCGAAVRSLPPVAVKIVRVAAGKDTVGKEKRVKKLRRELRVWHSLEHKNVLPLIATACLDGDLNLPAIVSPWMENGNVKQYLENNPAADREKIIMDVIEGLSYLHSSDPQIIHGDLKAANLLVDRRGNIYVADFGLSVMLEDATLWNTSATHLTGTVRWMAPEILRNEENRVTTKSDVYAFAMTCFEILSGQLPFADLRYDGAVMMAVAVRNERPSRLLVPTASGAVWNMMTQCWDANSDIRLDIKSAAKMMEPPQSFTEIFSFGIGTRKASKWQLASSRVNSQFVIMKDWSLFVGDYLTGRMEKLPIEIVGKPNRIQYSPDGSTLAVSQISTDSSGETTSIQLFSTTQWLRRSFTIYLGDSTCPNWDVMAFSLDGKWIVCVAKEVQIYNTRTGDQVFTQLEEEKPDAIAISPCGLKVAMGGDSYVHLLVTKRNSSRYMKHQLIYKWSPYNYSQNDGCRTISWSPTDDLLAVGYDDGEVVVWNTDNFQIFRKFKSFGSIAVFSQDGRMIACASGTLIHVRSTETGQAVGCPLRGHKNWVCSIAFSPDGRIISGSDDYTIRVWELK